jgi:putative helicase MOV10L1/helicase MOV-10
MLPLLRPAFTNLIRNYRSHPAILAVPSSLFYADTLEPEATDTARLATWSDWQGERWPVLFHDNGSEDWLEREGGGWYNIGEAQVACSYAARLVKSGLVVQEEVCIMSPFKAQVRRLRKVMRKEEFGSLWDVNIGPTEAFQGLERGVVILCTTRSNKRFLEKDRDLGWGIIDRPNSMNVALTRAKFGLIVIGKRDVLEMDPYWKAFLDFCDRNGLVAVNSQNSAGAANPDEDKCTRLEKRLLAKNRQADNYLTETTKVLGGVSQDDEMWANGQQQPRGE